MRRRGWIYLAGLAWLLAAPVAQAGDFSLGISEYRRGNYEAALHYLEPLALKGDPYAQFSLGVMYDEGVGLARNYALALKWYRKSAENGLVDGQYMTGMYYATGRGMKQNLQRAYVWLNLAAAGGHPDAERARDQEEDEMSRAETAEAQRIAADWLRKYPTQLTCKMRRCIFPSWRPKPVWTILDMDL